MVVLHGSGGASGVLRSCRRSAGPMGIIGGASGVPFALPGCRRPCCMLQQALLCCIRDSSNMLPSLRFFATACADRSTAAPGRSTKVGFLICAHCWWRLLLWECQYNFEVQSSPTETLRLHGQPDPKSRKTDVKTRPELDETCAPQIVQKTIEKVAQKRCAKHRSKN